MSHIHTVEVKNAKEVFDLIGDYRKRELGDNRSLSLKDSHISLMASLTKDYELWFNEIANDWQAPSKRDTLKWDEGEPQWLIALNIDGTVLAYVSLIVSNRKYMGISPGRILDVYILEGQNPLVIIPKLREAIDNLFWFYKAQSRR